MNFQKGWSSWEKGNRVSQRPDSPGNKKTRTNLKKKKRKKKRKTGYLGGCAETDRV